MPERFHPTLRWLAVASALTVLAGCFQPMAPSVEGHLRPDPPQAGQIPPPVAVTTVLPKPRPTAKPETYSVVVNSVPVQELLFALARDAKLNVDIHPGITGLVTLNAIDQTLPQLLSRIARQVDMRWEVEGPNLLVMPDTPYLRIYKIDYVNMDRSTIGTVGISSRVSAGATGGTGGTGGTASAGGASGTGTNASNVSVRNEQRNRFWDTLTANITDILRETDKVIPGQAQTAAAPPPPPGGQGAGGSGAGQGGAQGFTPATPNVLYREAASVISSPEAGVLTIRATARQHERIQEFLDQILANVRRQVLIEATIVEVELSNNYQQGIDWQIVSDGLRPFNIQQGATGTTTASPTGGIFSFAYSISNFNLTIKLLETFGNAKVISSPRVSVLNNQTAVLRVADDKVYFQVNAQVSQATNAPSLTAVTTTPQVVSVGFVMNVTPQISDTDTVLLNLRPSLSRITGYVADPNPLLAAAGVQNLVPEIRTRELESLMRVRSGDIAVMGGLIQDGLQNQEDLVPLVNRIPVIGNFFGNRNMTSTKSELVVFLRPVVIKDPSLDGDYKGYRAFVPGEDFMRQPHPSRRPCEWPDLEGCPK